MVLLIKASHMLGVECKRVDVRSLTPALRIALEDLRLERIAVVYPGVRRYPRAERVEAVPPEALAHRMQGLFPKTGRDRYTLPILCCPSVQ